MSASGGAGAGSASSVSPLIAPDGRTVYAFYGHGAVAVSPNFHVKTVKLPRNVIVVSFGDVCNDNDHLLHEGFSKLAKDGAKNHYLLNPMDFGPSIIAELSKYDVTFTGLSLQIARGDMGQSTPAFLGVPFTTFNSNTKDPAYKNKVFRSGVYQLPQLARNPNIIDIAEGARVSWEDIRTLFTYANLPNLDGITDRSAATLEQWYLRFVKKAMITLEDFFRIAAGDPSKYHIFYILACRSAIMPDGCPLSAKKIKSIQDAAKIAEIEGTLQAVREGEDGGAMPLGVPEPPRKKPGTCVMLGGSRKLKRKHKHRKYKNRRTRHKRRI